MSELSIRFQQAPAEFVSFFTTKSKTLTKNINKVGNFESEVNEKISNTMYGGRKHNSNLKFKKHVSW